MNARLRWKYGYRRVTEPFYWTFVRWIAESLFSSYERAVDRAFIRGGPDMPFGYVKAFTTNTLDRMEESRRPRVRAIARTVGMFIPRDWGNYFW